MKKGFTLIELLAVIVLLGIISILIYPMVDNVIENSEKRAFKSSIEGIYSAVNQDRASSGFTKNSKYIYENGVLTKTEESGKTLVIPFIIKTDGDLKDGNGTININKDGDIIVKIKNDKWYAYNDEINKTIELRDIGEYDPSWTPEECFTFDSTTGTITGYDESCGLDVVIPEYINGINVTNIGTAAFVPNKTDVIVTYYDDEGLCSVDGCDYMLPLNVAIENNIDFDIALPVNITSILLKGCHNVNTDEWDMVDINQVYSISDGYDSCVINSETEDIYENLGLGNLGNVDFINAIYLETIGHSSFFQNNISSINLTGLENLRELKSGSFYNHKMSAVDFTGCISLERIGEAAFYSEFNLITTDNVIGLNPSVVLGIDNFEDPESNTGK